MTSQDRIQCRGKMRVERSESVTREAYHLDDTQRALRLSTLTCACDARGTQKPIRVALFTTPWTSDAL